MKIGVAINAYDADGRGYSMGEPYRLYYARMAESRGRGNRPALQAALDAPDVNVDFGAATAFGQRVGFALESGQFRSEPRTPGTLLVTGFRAGEFDETLTIEGSGDFAIGGGSDQSLKPGPDSGYSLVVQDGRVGLYVFGLNNDLEPVKLGAGPHKYRLVRQNGGIWALIDGKVYGYARDPSPNVVISKLGLGTTHAGITLREMQYRILKSR